MSRVGDVGWLLRDMGCSRDPRVVSLQENVLASTTF